MTRGSPGRWSWPPTRFRCSSPARTRRCPRPRTDLAGQLSGVGLDVLYDDRKASPGVKFTDAEVLGMPIAVVVGRGLKNGVVEVRNRRTGERREVPVAEAVTAVRELTGR